MLSLKLEDLTRAFIQTLNLKKITIRQEVTDIHEKAFDNVEGLVIYGFTGSYAEEYANTVLSLPMYNGLSYEEQSKVIEVINQF